MSQSHGSAYRRGQEDQLKLKWALAWGEKGDISGFDCNVVVGDWLDWVSQKVSLYWGFTTQLSVVFTENSLKKRKYPVSNSSVGQTPPKKTLLMTDVRGECFEHPDRKKTASQITSCYNQSTKNSISERTTDGLQQQIATPSEKKRCLFRTRHEHEGWWLAM